jgi:TolB-like protein
MAKYVFRVICLLSALTLLYPSVSPAKTAKPVIAVFNFETANANDYLGPVTARYLMTALAYLGKYKVIEPEKIEKVLEGAGIGEGEAIETGTAATLGKKLGAMVACRGKVTKKGNKYTITVDFISTANAAVITSNSANVTGEANLSKGIDRIVGLAKD